MTREQARQKCKSDPFYLSEVLGVYDFAETRELHTELFETLPNPGRGEYRDLSKVKQSLILWPRGHFKTSAIVVYIVWLILNFPDIRILLMQGNLKLTRKWLAEVKSHFDGTNTKSLLPKLFPEFKPAAWRANNADEFTVDARERRHLPAASVTAASPNALSTGQHFDAFFADDLVNTKNFRNVELLDKLESEFNHFMPLLDPGSYTVMTGTRYHFADIYGRIIRRNQGEWAITVKGAFDGPNGALLFPERVTKDGRKIGFTAELLARLQSDDPEMFGPQYLNKILPTKQHLFPEPLLLGAVRSTKEADFPKDAPTVFTVDLNGASKRAEADHSVIAAGRCKGGVVWVTDVVGSTFTPYQLAVVLINMTLKHQPVAILVEQCPAAEYFLEYVRATAAEKGIRLPISIRKLSQQKDAKYIRIAAVEKWLRQKRLYFAAGITDFERLVEEFTQFPKGRHDDRPDAVAMLIDYFQQGVVLPTAPGKLPWFVTGDGRRGHPWEMPDAQPTNMLGDSFCC